MKTTKILMMIAMCGTAIVPIMSTAAYADTIQPPTAEGPNGATLAEMQSQCSAKALAHDIDGAGGDNWYGDVVEGDASLVLGPTELDGSRVIDQSSIVGTGTFTPGTVYIEGEPFRIGGSVNMFGDQYASSGSWSDSTYNFTANFNSTFAYAFSCDISQEVYHPPVHHEAEGLYVLDPRLIGTPQGEAALQACNAFNAAHAAGANQGFWGNSPQGNCVFEGTPAYDDPSYYDAPAFFSNEPGTAINQGQTDTLDGFEDHGGPVQANGGPFHIGQTVICISPSTAAKKGVPGEWVRKNGYGGDNCTTDWFKNHAIWGSGTDSSNGTYISVPDYSFY